MLICDEITSALDTSVQAAIVRLLEELQESEKLAILFVTHNLALVRTIADRVAVMHLGRIVEHGGTDAVLDTPSGRLHVRTDRRHAGLARHAMTRQSAAMDHIIAPGLAGFEDEWHFSHVVRDAGLLFASGVTGTDDRGHVDADPATQFELAFTHLRMYLDAAGASLGDILELTTYHVELRRHLAAFTAVKDRHIRKPYPAWSAIGVTELITPGTLVEIRAIARAPEPGV